MMSTPEDQFIKIMTEKYAALDFSEFPNAGKNVELDLGCGSGSFTTQLAGRHPERLVLAADVMIGRLRKLQRRIQRENIANVVPIRAEARHLVGYMLPDNSVDRLHVLCPDPWPKDKHRGNRLLCANFMARLHNVLKVGGQFHFSSDDRQYLEIVRRVVIASGLFQEDNALPPDIADIKSDFEKRWNSQGKVVTHCLWIAKNSD